MCYLRYLRYFRYLRCGLEGAAKLCRALAVFRPPPIRSAPLRLHSQQQNAPPMHLASLVIGYIGYIGYIVTMPLVRSRLRSVRGGRAL